MSSTVTSSTRPLPPPVPSAGLAAYAAEREKALEACPLKRSNYARYTASRRRRAEVDYLPIKLDIENVSRCNLRCVMCTVSDWSKGRRAPDLPLAAFEHMLEEQYGLVEIKLQGIGEPLMQGDDVFAMIGAARRRHIWVRTTTNATLLHLKGYAERLVDSGVNEIQVSIDAASAAVYEGIRRGARFNRVISNCERLNAVCRDGRVRVTKMWTVVQPANAAELEALVDLAADTGFTSQVFSLSLSDWGLDAWRQRNRGAGEEAVEAERLWALVERGRARGVDVAFWQVNEKYRRDDAATLCPWPFERAYIGSDLRVVPCCYIGNPDVLQIGPPITAERNFGNIWRGPEYTEFRRAHLSGSLPVLCRGCYSHD